MRLKGDGYELILFCMWPTFFRRLLMVEAV